MGNIEVSTKIARFNYIFFTICRTHVHPQKHRVFMKM